MARVSEQIDERLRRWLPARPVFFVATAPRSVEGHVNLSPKGMAGTFAVLGPHRVGYLDSFGSGAETIAHLRESGRVRLTGDPEFTTLRAEFGRQRTHGRRSIVVVDVDRSSDSCGYSVPCLEYVADRDALG